MSNIGYEKALIVTNMQMIITEIGCRLGQSCKIGRNVLVRTSVLEPSRSRSITSSKMGSRLLSTAAKLRALRDCVAKGEAEQTLDVLLKKLVRRPLWQTRVLYVPFSVALLLVGTPENHESQICVGGYCNCC